MIFFINSKHIIIKLMIYLNLTFYRFFLIHINFTVAVLLYM